MNSTPTSKLVNSKYKSFVISQVTLWRKSYNRFLDVRENYIKFAYETQGRSFNQIAEDIRNVATCKEDDITGEAIRLIYREKIQPITEEVRS